MYLDDKNKDSVTSGTCIWVRRSTKTTEPVLVTELDTHLTATTEVPKPMEDLFMPIPPGEVLPDPDKLIYHAREILPNACLLDAYKPRVQPAIQPPPVDVSLPYDKIERFWTAHNILPFHICMDSCYTEFMDFMQYTSDDIVKIEIATKGQAINTNWKLARKGIITSSNF